MTTTAKAPAAEEPAILPGRRADAPQVGETAAAPLNLSTPMGKRALKLAETALNVGFRLRHQSSQIPGLALILMVFAENEIRLAHRVKVSR